jgi:HEAT repeat protein
MASAASNCFRHMSSTNRLAPSPTGHVSSGARAGSNAPLAPTSWARSSRWIARPVSVSLTPCSLSSTTKPIRTFIASIVVALGHTGDERGRDPAVRLSSHADVGIRFAVAFALPSLSLDDVALDALRGLSTDEDDDVRDWATFGLAESDDAGERTIAALRARVVDPHDDTRAEAIYGLARRHQPDAPALVERELALPVHGALIERARDALGTDGDHMTSTGAD